MVRGGPKAYGLAFLRSLLQCGLDLDVDFFTGKDIMFTNMLATWG